MYKPIAKQFFLSKKNINQVIHVQIIGFIVGAIPWVKNLIIGDGAPLRVIQDSIKLLG